MTGRLYICATPIGNLEDVTHRLLRVLGEADIIAAEDTRRARKLLTHYSIRGELVSYHEQNERKQAGFLVERMLAGSRVALVTDGGMPAISDPGYHLLQSSIEHHVPIEVVPGPSAVLSALVVSGLATARFCFEGFLPRKPGEQTSRLKALAADDRTLVLFEAPGRLKATLTNIRSVLGDRRIAVARELTKLHEEVIRGTVSEVLASLDDEVRGEIVVVVEGVQKSTGDLESAVGMAQALIEKGASKSQAAAEAARRFLVPRRSVYEKLLN